MKKIVLSLLTVFMVLSLSVVLVKANETATTVSLEDGVQIRTDGNNGLKWVANVESPAEGNEYGFLFAKGDLAEVTVETAGVVKEVVEDATADQAQIAATMTKFPKSAAAQDISVVAYVLADGVYTYSNVVVRNLAEVAVYAKNSIDGDFVNSVVQYVEDNYKNVYTDSLGNLFVTNAVYETNPANLKKAFLADWNAKFGTEFATYSYTEWAASASAGYGEGVGMTSTSDTDCSGTNAYEFFITDEATSAKWGWLLNFFLNETKTGVHPKRQINALLNGGSYSDSYGGGLQQFAHLSRSLYNFFTAQGKDVFNSAIDVVISDLSVYNNIANYNQTVYAQPANLVALESDYDFNALSKNGYEFAGYTDGTNNFNSSLTVVADAFLKPVFTPVEYTVKFYSEGNEITELATTYTIEDALVLPGYEADGYTLEGWYDNEGLEGEAVTSIAKGSTGAKEFHAKLIEAFAVTYNLNGGNTVYDSFAAMSADFMADYNAVTGKNTTADQLYEAGNVMTTFFANDEMYAKWVWTIQLMHDLCEAGYGQNAEALAQYDAILAGETPAAQWAIRQNMEGLMTMTAGGGYSGSISIDFSLVEVQSQIFNWLNGGKEAVKYVDATNELVTPVRPGYVFAGWYDNEGFEGEAVTSVSETTALYAKWTEGTYKVTYVLNNDDADIVAEEVTTSTLEKYTLVTPTYDNTKYQFNGWFADEELTTPIIDIAAINDEDVTVYGKWTELSGYIVTYNFNGGNTKYATREAMVEDFLVDAMTKYGKTQKPTTMQEFATVFSAMYTLFTDANYAAKWAWLKEYIIATAIDSRKSFVESGTEADWRYSVGAFLFKEHRTSWPAGADFTNEELANGYADTLSAKETTIYAVAAGDAPLTVVYKPGYTLEGWYTTEDFQEGTKVTSVTGDCTLYAKWVA